MAVIINDFEVIVDSPAAPAAGGDAPSPAPAGGPRLAPHDLEDLERHRHERAARLRAH